MADVDDVLVCERCLHPVDELIVCPDCQEPVVKMSSLLLQSLRILKAKGWVVESWEQPTDLPYKFKITFYFFAPPVEERFGSFPELSIAVELKDLKPSVLAFGDTIGYAAKNLYGWAERVSCFALPFAQDLCDLCRQQAGDWFFSRCRCPILGKGGWALFGKGLPDKCVYADVQVVTKEVRLKQLETFFQRNPIARRKVRKEFPNQRDRLEELLVRIRELPSVRKG